MKMEVCAYAAPEMKVIRIRPFAIFCISPGGNSGMSEYDLGDGGFAED